MTDNAHARAADPGAATSCSDNNSTAKDSPGIVNGQAVTLPARARLLEGPARDWLRIPTTVASSRMLATILCVTPRCIAYWRAGQRTPRWRHKRRLMMLQALVRCARQS